jgi:ketosteroid isomerase-like protein
VDSEQQLNPSAFQVLEARRYAALMKKHLRIGMFAALACASAAFACTRAPTPATAANELLEADRAFGKAAQQTDAIAALSAMFDEEVILPLPGGRFAEGKAEASAALQSSPQNLNARLEWAPVRAGISADGQHGFTFGYMTQHRPDTAATPFKYLAYWIKRPEGWRVLTLRRRPAPAATTPQMMEPSLPERIVAASSDTSAIARSRESLADAERSFSRDAQSVGLGEAFTRYGSPDAVNMGGPNDTTFVFGAEAIGRAIGAGTPTNSSPVSWGPDRKVYVASSGDLGITFGLIRSNTPPDGKEPPAVYSFFTVWRRAGTTGPWRYIAE